MSREPKLPGICNRRRSSFIAGSSRLAVTHPVAHSANGADESAGYGAVTEFAAQTGDMDFDDVGIADPVGSPDFGEQLLSTEHNTGPPRERFENVELSPSQLHGCALHLDFTTLRVEGELPYRPRVRLAGWGRPWSAGGVRWSV